MSIEDKLNQEIEKEVLHMLMDDMIYQYASYAIQDKDCDKNEASRHLYYLKFLQEVLTK